MPVFQNFQHGFRVVVFANEQNVVDNVVDNVVERVGKKVVETLSANQEMILEFIKKNPDKFPKVTCLN